LQYLYIHYVKWGESVHLQQKKKKLPCEFWQT
jgi:hypothetical protein